MIVLPLPSASALPSDARPSDRATAVGAVAAEIDPAVLARRGQELLAVGDIVAARRFFERAAEAGNAPAATGAGRTYDPLYLRQVARGLRGDPDKAADWYLKAVALGDSEAGVLLMRLLAARTP
jgi:TPR repeat protein